MNGNREEITVMEKKLTDAIEDLGYLELYIANLKHPEFHSMAEASAVILEEIEELAECLRDIREMVNRLWESNRKDDLKQFLIATESIRGYVIALIKEALQVLAMCIKANDLGGGEDEN